MDFGTRHLLTIPPEIRLRIYSFVFAAPTHVLLGVSTDGQLLQPEHDVMRNQDYKRANLSAQFLRTCSQIYHEGLAYLFSFNNLQMLDVDTHNLDNASHRLSLPTRALMTKLEFLNRPNKRLDLPAISGCFPSLQNIHIHTQGSGASFLTLAYELAKSLPCSSIRQWPSLELHVQIPQSTTAVKIFEGVWDTETGFYWQVNDNAKDASKVETLFRNASFKVTDLEPYIMKYFMLGKEMPHFERIILHGGLTQKFVGALGRYESTYGDCKFELTRKELNIETDKPGVWDKEVYVWKREGTAVASAVRGKDLTDTAALMRQWVPALSEEFTKALVEEYSCRTSASLSTE